jgi:(1->4)-alpha-D-glucan 1-alpha-D-glucosylmutase
MKPPRATYRLQLNADFTLRHALDLVPYLDELGVSHAYLSPILKAQPGSTHGYDTVDHTLINPELGTIEDFRALGGALRARGMGVILDIVPNHMGVGGADNQLWLDLLRHGPESRYADWFDINWSPPRPGMEGKLLVPFLGKPYAEVLVDGDLRLDRGGGGFAVWAYEKEKLPIRPEDAERLMSRYGSGEAVIAAHADPAVLEGLVAKQHWRLAHFLTAGDEINYRRFFINSELAGVRIDRPEVFDHVHALTFQLIEEGLVDGLRIDHIDGLRDPQGYLERLREKSPRPVYLLVEKILAPHEYLPDAWPIDGTTGYEVGAQLTRLLTPASGEEAVTAIYEDFVGTVPSPQEEAIHCKFRVMDHELAVELSALARLFAELAWSAQPTADLTELGLRRVLRALIAQLEVYRTYIGAGDSTKRDRRELRLASIRARRDQPHLPPAAFDFVEGVLTGSLGEGYNQATCVEAIARFQQYTGPVMAKGLEDTALYRYNRLASLNEVGAHPDRFSLSIAAFHDSNRRRLKRHAHGMIATSTHDTKRGEDIRLIISAIADLPEPWAEAVETWGKVLGEVCRPIHPNDLYLFVQLLLGGWPISGSADNLAERLKGAMTKSLREARQRSDWGVNNQAYEAAMGSFIDAALSHAGFMENFHSVGMKFREVGRRKALIQTVLKLTIPGVPDIYRGAEDWEQSFVDPDNRRPLDFAALARRLAKPDGDADEKLTLTQSLLHLRRAHPDLFAMGDYKSLDLGPEILGFRRSRQDIILTVLADLSPLHQQRLPELAGSGSTVAGSADGPFWVLLSEK